MDAEDGLYIHAHTCLKFSSPFSSHFHYGETSRPHPCPNKYVFKTMPAPPPKWVPTCTSYPPTARVGTALASLVSSLQLVSEKGSKRENGSRQN